MINILKLLQNWTEKIRVIFLVEYIRSNQDWLPKGQLPSNLKNSNNTSTIINPLTPIQNVQPQSVLSSSDSTPISYSQRHYPRPLMIISSIVTPLQNQTYPHSLNYPVPPRFSPFSHLSNNPISNSILQHNPISNSILQHNPIFNNKTRMTSFQYNIIFKS